MDQRRQLLPILIAIPLAFLWIQIAPVLFPNVFGKPQPPVEQVVEVEEPVAPAITEIVGADGQPVAVGEPQEFPEQLVTLGGPGFEQGYLLKVDVTSLGGALKAVWLTDPRYTTLDRKEQLRVVGNEIDRNVRTSHRLETFDTKVAEIDQYLASQKLSLATVNWEIVSHDDESAVLRYPSPDGRMEVVKTYRIKKVESSKSDYDASGYMVDLVLELKNASGTPLVTKFTLTGPVGVPLENVQNARVFREIKLGTIENVNRPSRISATSTLARTLVNLKKDADTPGGKPLIDWRAPIHYAGVDDQFFAGLVFPKHSEVVGQGGERLGSKIEVVRPELLSENVEFPDRSDMTIVMESTALTVPANGSVTSEFSAFFGPKRPALMKDLRSEQIINLGWFNVVAKFMLWILDGFHRLGFSYALAIILLTVVVRLCLFPISKKQAIEAEKMRVLAPKMREMQEKYKNKPEEFAKAYREFQRKHNYNPLVGCLPALLQLPIFIGLYNALFHAVDLRLAKMLWVDNLAAPDQLFKLGFTVPWLGWEYFNLLPFLTVALFVAQQKLLMPPPTSDEQRMQYKVMNYMMIGVGFMFYTVPAGLCLYFISSSIWGLLERTFLKKSLAARQALLAEAAADGTGEAVLVDTGKASATSKSEPKAPTFWQRALEAADGARNAAEKQAQERKFSKDKSKKPKRR